MMQVQTGAYSKKYQYFAKEQLKSLREQYDSRSYSCRLKEKELSNETKRRQKKLEEKKRKLQDEEDRRRKTILEDRRKERGRVVQSTMTISAPKGGSRPLSKTSVTSSQRTTGRVTSGQSRGAQSSSTQGRGGQVVAATAVNPQKKQHSSLSRTHSSAAPNKTTLNWNKLVEMVGGDKPVALPTLDDMLERLRSSGPPEPVGSPSPCLSPSPTTREEMVWQPPSASQGQRGEEYVATLAGSAGKSSHRGHTTSRFSPTTAAAGGGGGEHKFPAGNDVSPSQISSKPLLNGLRAAPHGTTPAIPTVYSASNFSERPTDVEEARSGSVSPRSRQQPMPPDSWADRVADRPLYDSLDDSSPSTSTLRLSEPVLDISREFEKAAATGFSRTVSENYLLPRTQSGSSPSSSSSEGAKQLTSILKKSGQKAQLKQLLSEAIEARSFSASQLSLHSSYGRKNGSRLATGGDPQKRVRFAEQPMASPPPYNQTSSSRELPSQSSSSSVTRTDGSHFSFPASSEVPLRAAPGTYRPPQQQAKRVPLPSHVRSDGGGDRAPVESVGGGGGRHRGQLSEHANEQGGGPPGVVLPPPLPDQPSPLVDRPPASHSAAAYASGKNANGSSNVVVTLVPNSRSKPEDSVLESSLSDPGTLSPSPLHFHSPVLTPAITTRGGAPVGRVTSAAPPPTGGGAEPTTSSRGGSSSANRLDQTPTDEDIALLWGQMRTYMAENRALQESRREGLRRVGRQSGLDTRQSTAATSGGQRRKTATSAATSTAHSTKVDGVDHQTRLQPSASSGSGHSTRQQHSGSRGRRQPPNSSLQPPHHHSTAAAVNHFKRSNHQQSHSNPATQLPPNSAGTSYPSLSSGPAPQYIEGPAPPDHVRLWRPSQGWRGKYVVMKSAHDVATATNKMAPTPGQMPVESVSHTKCLPDRDWDDSEGDEDLSLSMEERRLKESIERLNVHLKRNMVFSDSGKHREGVRTTRSATSQAPPTHGDVDRTRPSTKKSSANNTSHRNPSLNGLPKTRIRRHPHAIAMAAKPHPQQAMQSQTDYYPPRFAIRNF